MHLPEELRKRLSHPSPRVRARAVHALAGVHGAEAAQAVRWALEDASPIVRAGAALVLGLREASEAVQQLAQHLRYDTSVRVRIACAAALGWIGTPPALRALVDATGDPEGRVVEIACVALAKTGDAKWEPVFLKVLRHKAWRARLRACEALIYLGCLRPEVLATLQHLAKQPEADAYERLLHIQKGVNAVSPPSPLDEFWSAYSVRELIDLFNDRLTSRGDLGEPSVEHR
jgi:HEAT repeat protein